MTQLFMAHPGPLQVRALDIASGFTLRAGTTDDAAGLSVLLEDAFAEPWGEQRVHSALLAADDVVSTWVITTSDAIVGTASERLLPEQYPGAGYVHWVGVLAAARGHRLGQILTQACLNGFADGGQSRAVLETDDFRLPAIRTYLRIGFVPEYRSDAERRAWSEVFPRLDAQPTPRHEVRHG